MEGMMAHIQSKFRHFFNDFIIYVDDFGTVRLSVENKFCFSWEIKKVIASTELKNDLLILTEDGVELFLDCNRKNKSLCKFQENEETGKPQNGSKGLTVERKLEVLKSTFEEVAPLGINKKAIEQILRCSKELGLRSDEEAIVESYKKYLKTQKKRQ